jgi:hypothetical protein
MVEAGLELGSSTRQVDQCSYNISLSQISYRISRGLSTTFFHFSFVHILIKNCGIKNLRPDSESSLRFGIGIRS